MKTFWTCEFESRTYQVLLKQIDVVTHGDLAVPVWRLIGGNEGISFYEGPFVRHEDLPEDVRTAFQRWQLSAQIPFANAAYVYDFEFFAALHRFVSQMKQESIWLVAPVENEPEIRLARWSIREILPKKTRHFVGYNTSGEGRVSSAILEFDPNTRRGRTQSGRVYELVADPGYDRDAEYVWQQWCQVPGQMISEWRDVTAACFGMDAPAQGSLQ